LPAGFFKPWLRQLQNWSLFSKKLTRLQKGLPFCIDKKIHNERHHLVFLDSLEALKGKSLDHEKAQRRFSVTKLSFALFC